MNRRVLLIAAGIVAFLVFMIAMVPASQLARRLPEQVAMGGVGGTIWSGRAASLSVDGHSLGATDWSCRPWPLVKLEWSCRVTVKPPGGAVSADLSGGFGGAVDGRNINGQLPIGVLEGVVTPKGWTGMLELDVAHLRIVDQRPEDAAGTLVLRGLKAPGAAGQLLGDFELVVGEGAVGTDTLTGRLRDLGGPLHVRGAVELKRDGSYLMKGDAAPGPGAGPAIFDALSFLGPPDDLGRRPFTIEGTI